MRGKILARSAEELAMRRIFLPLVAGLCLAFAPAPFPRPMKPGQSDLKALQGEWDRDRVTIGGILYSEKGRETSILIAQDRMKYAVAGKPTNEWVFTLNKDTKPPELDRKGVKGAALGFTYRGIYRLEGDTFTLCSRDNVRPMDFDTPGTGVYVEVFKRKKR
jgi:uncharacterized protein (TIGR03067 family)